MVRVGRKLICLQFIEEQRFQFRLERYMGYIKGQSFSFVLYNKVFKKGIDFRSEEDII